MFYAKLIIPNIAVVDLDYIMNGGLLNHDIDVSQFVTHSGSSHILSKVLSRIIDTSTQYTTKELAAALRKCGVIKAYAPSDLVEGANNNWLVVDAKTGTHRYTSIRPEEGLDLPPFYYKSPYLKDRVLVKENNLFFASNNLVKPYVGIEQIIVRKGSV